MINYLKKNYISETTCRLLICRLEKDLISNVKTIKYFKYINFTNDIREKLFCLINNINEIPKCKNENCINKVKFLNFTQGYRKFCCIKCSKNPEEINKINIFNGVHKIRSTPVTNKTLYFKEVRKITSYTYKQNKNILNPNNYKFGRAGIEGAYQLDHIISVDYGYNHDISPDIIGGLDNLQVIPWRVNSVKNKFINLNLDTENIIKNYVKQEYNSDLSIEEFVNKYCLDKSGRINTKINKEWFINRNVLQKYYDIINLTDYLHPNENLNFRILNVHYGIYKSKISAIGNRANWIRMFLTPKKDYVTLTDNNYIDFKINFLCYDKRIKKYRLKSNSYDLKSTANKKGILFLYYKYINELK